MRALQIGLLALVLAACSSGGAQQPSTPPPTPPTAAVPLPSDMQPGADWELVWGAGMKGPNDVTLRFDTGLMSGRGPVNRYTGMITATDAGAFHVDQLTSTKMAGPKPLMADEGVYFEALRGADGWQAGEDQLSLMRGDQPVLRYALPDSPAAFGKTLIGMPVAKARARADDEGYQTRVVSVDGQQRPATTDYRPDRLNLTVVNGDVTEVTTG